MSTWLKYTAVFLVAPAIAAASAVASLSTVLAKKAPERAIQLPIVDANAYADLAMDKIAFAQAGADGGVDGDLASRALQTFRSEPTSSRAISLLALTRQLSGDTEGARRLYADALMLSQRDRLANLSLIEDASQRGKIAFILERYDALLRTGGATADTLFSVLGSAMREEAIVPHLEASLARRPPWAEQFWLRVTPNKEAIENVAKLRLRLLSRRMDNPAGNDAEIVRRLVDNGHLALAYRLFRGVSQQEVNGSGLLRNAEFDDTPGFVPFDWAIFSDAQYSTEVDPLIGALVVFIESSSNTLVARQLLKLPRGRYSVNIRTRDAEAARSTSLSVRIHCADASPVDARGQVSVEPKRGPQAVEYTADCEFSWVELWARSNSASQVSAPTDVMVDAIDLAPAGQAVTSSNRRRVSGAKTSNPALEFG